MGKRNERENNVETAYMQIREGILLGDYAPGAALSENALAKAIGVSRTPVRHALLRLEFDGLVTSQHGLGTTVTILDVVSLKEIHALRLRLAELIGELSGPVRLTDDDWAVFDDILDRCRALQAEYNPRELVRINMEFHEMVMNTIANETLRQFYSQLYYRTNQLWLQLLPKLNWEEEVQENVAEYTAVIDCLHKDDMKAVGEIRKQYIERCFTRILHYLGDV
jgi:DNA-binding GntR family transcriptional regulator